MAADAANGDSASQQLKAAQDAQEAAKVAKQSAASAKKAAASIEAKKISLDEELKILESVVEEESDDRTAEANRLKTVAPGGQYDDGMKIAAALFFASAILLLMSAYLAESTGVYRLIAGAGERVLDALGTLLIVALFVERAQQVLVAAWRGIQRAAIEERINRYVGWQEKAAQLGASFETKKRIEFGLRTSQGLLAHYRATTRRLILPVGLFLGILIAAVGPRILSEVLEPLDDITGLQAGLFALADVVITGGLIGGGSEGIHKLVVVITDSLDATRQRVTAAAQSPQPGQSQSASTK